MEVKLKSGKKVKVKNISLDERDGLLDSVNYDYNKDGTVKGVVMMYTTMTKWMRTCIDGDVSDKVLLSFTLEEKTDLFTKLQSMFLVGEENASK